MDLAVILSAQMIVIHKLDGDWTAKLPTESNGTLSINIVSGSFKGRKTTTYCFIPIIC